MSDIIIQLTELRKMIDDPKIKKIVTNIINSYKAQQKLDNRYFLFFDYVMNLQGESGEIIEIAKDVGLWE